MVLILQLSVNSAVIDSTREVELKCETVSRYENHVKFNTCSLVNLQYSPYQVFVTSTNLDVEEQMKHKCKIIVNIFGHEDYPEYFPKNLGKTLHGIGELSYKNTP